jgi:plastocyanin
MRRTSITAAACLAALTILPATGAGAGGGKTVKVLGTEDFQPNVRVFSNFRFAPGPITVASGDELTFDDRTDAPHTVTIVNPEEVPKTTEDLFDGECGTCDDAFDGHFPGGFGGPVNEVVDVEGEGLDAVGDSILWFGDGASVKVSAPPGTTLDYICAIHPWMQGQIRVK